jgi:hypothetical protein
VGEDDLGLGYFWVALLAAWYLVVCEGGLCRKLIEWALDRGSRSEQE